MPVHFLMGEKVRVWIWVGEWEGGKDLGGVEGGTSVIVCCLKTLPSIKKLSHKLKII